MGTLRFLLAISVVISHAGPIFGLYLIDSHVAVEAFFIISGFYMSLILGEKYAGLGHSYTVFLRARLLRIYPTYWIVLIMTFIVSLIAFLQARNSEYSALQCFANNADRLQFGPVAFLIFANLGILLQDLCMFLGINADTGNLRFVTDFRSSTPPVYQFLFVPQAWTISIELMFYLVAPFIVRRSVAVIIAIAVFSIVVRLILTSYGLRGDPWSHRFVLSEMVFFCLGALSYRIYGYLKTVRVSNKFGSAVFIGVVAFCLLYSFAPTSSKQLVFYLVFFLGLPAIFLHTKNWKFDSYIGELSYPIYLCHILVILMFRTWLRTEWSLAELILTILLSVLLKEVLIERVEKYRKILFLKASEKKISKFGSSA